MVKAMRNLLWRILGFDYQTMLLKTDYVLLKNDRFTSAGRGTYDNGAKVWRWSDALLKIGNYCCIAHDVNFILDEGYHKGSTITNYPFINDKNIGTYPVEVDQLAGIEIGNDVWIGMGAFIMPGVKIGNGVTIGANSVVTKDIPDYALVAGSPAKILKYKFSDEQIERLNRIGWWDWPESKIQERKLDFYQLSLDEFITKNEQQPKN